MTVLAFLGFTTQDLGFSRTTNERCVTPCYIASRRHIKKKTMVLKTKKDLD